VQPLIVGGGPAGCAAAITLARGGMRPVLVERSREPRNSLCGGFLSWRSLETLAGLGIEAQDLNANAIGSVRLFAGHRHAEASLPAPGLAVSRRRLDSLLLERTTAAGAGIEQGVAVREVQGTQVRLQPRPSPHGARPRSDTWAAAAASPLPHPDAADRERGRTAPSARRLRWIGTSGGWQRKPVPCGASVGNGRGRRPCRLPSDAGQCGTAR
jgi:2-polyprenyl-6-methoxyphenol hydroxylase-like FAD-dependent oxidoreductase